MVSPAYSLTDLTCQDSVNREIARRLSVVVVPLPLNLADWADQHFYLSRASSGVEGAWTTYPYQRAIMNALSNDDIQVLTLQKGSRLGGTKMLMAGICYFAQHKRRSQVVYLPTDSAALDLMKDEIDPMLLDCEIMRTVLTDPGAANKRNTLSKKQFNGSVLDVRGGKSPRAYRHITRDVAMLDDLDGFDRQIGQEGSAVSLAGTRLTNAPFPKLIVVSTPTVKGDSPVEAEIDKADAVYRYHVMCPHCNERHPYVWGDFICSKGAAAETIQWYCPGCGAGSPYSAMPEMAEQGRWCTDQDGDTHAFTWTEDGDRFFDQDDAPVAPPRHIGFVIWAAYSYDMSWAEILQEHRDAGKNPVELRTFVNQRLAETYEESSDAIDTLPLYRRREKYLARVPAGVVVLTAAVDTQDDRFEIEILGWGAGEESWQIDYRRLYGDPGRPEIWRKLHEHLLQSFIDEAGEQRQIRLTMIDKGGHYGDEVTAFSRRYGTMRYIPIVGVPELANNSVVRFPNSKNDKRVYLTRVAANTGKDIVFDRLNLTEPGPGYCHWPIAEFCDEEYFRQLGADRRTWKYLRGRRVSVWDHGNRRNEPWDLRRYNLAAIRLLTLHWGVRLDAPPPVPVVKATTVPAPRVIELDDPFLR